MMHPEAMNCCKAPDPQHVRELVAESHLMVDIYRCAACGQHWLDQWYEEINFDGGDDYTNSYYTRLTPEEAKALPRRKNPKCRDLAAGTTTHFRQGDPTTKRAIPIPR